MDVPGQLEAVIESAPANQPTNQTGTMEPASILLIAQLVAKQKISLSGFDLNSFTTIRRAGSRGAIIMDQWVQFSVSCGCFV
jgi:hypothetical protein